MMCESDLADEWHSCPQNRMFLPYSPVKTSVAVKNHEKIVMFVPAFLFA
jgi:hypothetical protein